MGNEASRTLKAHEVEQLEQAMQQAAARERWVLQRGAELIPLGRGETVLGRAPQCDIIVDNHMVSRRHAKVTVTDDGVLIEDLGSVNGVRVNGVPLQGNRPITAGDRISIADTVFELLRSSIELSTRSTQRETQDAPDEATTRRINAFNLMVGVVDKAIALGKAEDAERLLGTLMSEILDEAQRTRRLPHEVAETANRAALKLAAASGKRQWVEYPIRLFAALGRILPIEVVDELFVVARRAQRLDLPLLHHYVAMLESMKLGPSDRFVVQRLQNLARMMGAVGGR